MAGLQYTPGGIRPLGDISGIDVNAQHGAFVSRPEPDDEAPEPVAVAPRVSRVIAKPAVTVNGTISPRTVIKAARARVKEIRAELRRMRGLQKELEQLERMLAAAGKPLASLTPITSRRAG